MLPILDGSKFRLDISNLSFAYAERWIQTKNVVFIFISSIAYIE